MRLIKNTTELIGIKDQNINISLVFETDTHIEIQAKLDSPAPSCPHCHGKMIKYDFQKPSKIPLLEQAGTPTLLRLKKRRFQCKSCRRVTVAETSIVEKNCQISNLVRQKVTQLLTEKVSLTDIARRLRVSTSTVYRKTRPVLLSRNTMTNSQLLCPGMSLGSRKGNWLLWPRIMRQTNS